MAGVIMHGGVRMLGAASEITNLQLEELAVDPESPGVGRIWLNTTEKTLKYVSQLSDNNQPVVVVLLDSEAITALEQDIASKADIATTLAGYGIIDGVKTDDLRINDPVVLVVSKTPGMGQFSSIAAAINSITDAESTKPYLVKVQPGVYTEPKIVTQPFVIVHGSGQETTFIVAQNANDHLIEGTINSALMGVSLDGAVGEGCALVHMDNDSGYTTRRFRVEEVRFKAAHTLVLAESGFVNINSCSYGSEHSFVRGFIAKDKGVNETAISLRLTSANGMTTPYPTVLYQADGPLSQILILAGMNRASDSLISGGGVGVGMHLRNGGRVRMVASAFIGYDKAIWSENAGAGPVIEAAGCTISMCNQDLVIDHPATTGSFMGNATRAKTSVNADTENFALFYSDMSGAGIVSLGPIFVGKSHSSLTDIGPLINGGMQLGSLAGGILSKGVGLNAHITAGEGYVRYMGALRYISWPDTVLPVAANATNYIYVDSSGVVSFSSAPVDDITNIVFGRALTDDIEIVSYCTSGYTDITLFNPNLDKFLKEILGPMYVSGSVVTENSTTPRALDITAGHYFYSTSERFPAERTAATLVVAHHTAGLPDTVTSVVVGNTSYDNGTDLVTLPAGYYTKHVLYAVGTGEEVIYVLQHGNGSFATLQAAKDAPLPPVFADFSGCPSIAAVIVQQGVNNIVEIMDLRPRPLYGAASVASGLTRHGDLIGLLSDDHPQYLRTNGSRKLSGDLDINNHALLNVTTLNNVVVEDHSARHLPNGLDALPTAPAVSLTPVTENTEGVANSFARSDHTHDVSGFQVSSAQLDAIAAASGVGVLRRAADGTWSISAEAAASNVIHVTVNSIPIMSGNTVMTFDNNTPSAAEGTQLWSETITPNGVDSIFELEFTPMVDCGNKFRTITMAIFRRIGTGPTVLVGFTGVYFNGSNEPKPASIKLVDTPNTTQPVTYSCRIGVNSNGTSWYVGRGAQTTQGGVNQSGYSVKEMRP